MLATQLEITSYRLFSHLLCASSMIHPGDCRPAPSPVGFNRPFISQNLLLEFSCANPTTLIAQDHLFRNFSLYAYAPPLKTPLAPSPVSITQLFLKASVLSYLV